MGIKILKAVRSDVKALAGLAYPLHEMAGCYVPAAAAKLAPNAKRRLRDYYRKVLKSEKHFVFKAVDGEKTVGFFELALCELSLPFRQTAYLEVMGLFVLPEYRKHGIASKFFKEMENLAKKKKIKELRLSCWSSNVEAMKFYQKQGFAEYRKVMKKFI